MLDRIVGDPEDGDPVADTRVKPALLTLLSDQAALIDAGQSVGHDHDLRTGFPSRRALIEWYQRASVRTVGHIADEWDPVDCVGDDTLVRALVYDPVGGMDPMDHSKAVEYRRVLEAKVVQPACNRAYRALRDGANEYISDDDGPGSMGGDLDPRNQKNVAMRPGFQSLDRQQERVLGMLWDGFGSTDDLMDWLHGLNSPTNGEIDGDIAETTVTDDVALQHLLFDPETPEAEMYQAAFAATVLLPAFVDGVRTTETAELAKAQRDSATTFRMKQT